MSRDHFATSSRVESARGAAVAELALVFPLIFFLFAAAFESGRGLAMRNQVELLSQQLSTAVFHECKDKDLTDGNSYTADEAKKCLPRELEALHASFRSANPRSAAIATLYRKGPAGLEILAGPERSCDASASADFHCDQFVSRFTLARAQAELQPLADLTGWVVVVETFLEPDGSVERLLYPLGLENVTYYSVSVL